MLARESNDASLGAPADGACDVQRRRLRSATRHDERFERLELIVAAVDGALELRNPRMIDARFLEVLVHFLEIGRREQRADREQIVLNRREDIIDPRQWLGGHRNADRGIQFVDIAIRLDARMTLRNTSAAEETSVALVAGFGVDLQQVLRIFVGRNVRRGKCRYARKSGCA